MTAGRARGIDVVAAVLAGTLVLEWVGVLLIQPTYRRLLADFGAELPWLTGLTLSPWPVTALVAATVLVVLEGAVRRRPDQAMVARVIGVIVVGLAIPALFGLGAYLPVFELSSAIQ